MPSTPGAPLLRRTCASAFLRLSRSTTLSMDGPTQTAGPLGSALAVQASVPSGVARGASPVASAPKGQLQLAFLPLDPHEITVLFAHSTVRAFVGLSQLLCPLLTSLPRSRGLRPVQAGIPNTTEITRGKPDRLRRTPAGSTTPALDGPGLRSDGPARPAG